MKLFINTTIAKKAVCSLLDEKGKVVSKEVAQDPLIALDRLLKKSRTKLEDLDEISSHPGPGSFTGLRVGASVAQALNFALGKKVKTIKIKYE
jgi:tRNA threonylcarbamoyladenosine biosynthesis protein TsaB